MGEVQITHVRVDSTTSTCRLSTPSGNYINVTAALDDEHPQDRGSPVLQTSPALIRLLWESAIAETQSRQTAPYEVRKSYVTARDESAKQAKALAPMVERVGTKSRSGYCSACLHQTRHRIVEGFSRPARTYLCGTCGSPTTPCAAPGCGNFATRRLGVTGGPRYCAEHRHEIPSFGKLEHRLAGLEDYEDWLSPERANWARATRLIGATTVGGMLLGPAFYFNAPGIGGFVGAHISSHTGAAATSHGLAFLGGGAKAAGGLGMAGGTGVVTAVGGSLGGRLGATTAMAYLRSDPSFRLEKIRNGVGAPLVLANGFLTDKSDSWSAWQPLIDQRYPAHPVYRVHWGSKELRDLAAVLGEIGGRHAVKQVIRRGAERASKEAAKLPGITPATMAFTVLRNPWSVAKARAEMTGAALADLIARTDEDEFILVGHSLGARVMVHAAQALGTRSQKPKVHSMHLLGAAIRAQGDWRTLNNAVSDGVWNYWSCNDQVLARIYRVAQIGQVAAGARGFQTRHERIKDIDVSTLVRDHSAYFAEVKLR